jgi:hypothetical protein
MKNLQGYYGFEYNPVQAQVIKSYLTGLSLVVLKVIYPEILRVKLYANRLPLIEHIEEAKASVEKRLEEMRPLSAYDMYRPLEIEYFESDLTPEQVRAKLQEKAPWLNRIVGVKEVKNDL